MLAKKELGFWRTALIIAIMPLGGFAVDIYTPSLPDITHLLHGTEFQVKLTIAIYMFGYGLGQLFAGPLSDRLGRKPILHISFMVFFLASVLAAFSQTIMFLTTMRLFQGLAISGLILNVRTVLADTHEGLALRKVSIYIATAWALSPIIGPVIGGYLHFFLGWRSCFYFLAAYALLLGLLIFLFVPETSQRKESIAIRNLLNNYKQVVKSREYMRNVLGLALAFSLMNVFNVMGPFLIQVQLHKSVLFYAKIALLIGICGFVGSLTNRFLVRYFSLSDVISLCVMWMVITSIASLFMSILLSASIIMIVVPVGLIMFAAMMLYPNFSANCSGMFKHIAGTAAACRGVISITITAICTGIISHLQSSFVTFFIVYVFLALSLWIITKKL